MKLWAPAYYQAFHCIADRCTHSCCIGWEIDVDEATLETYKALPGALGAQIRASIAEREDGAHFVLGRRRRCPHLDGRGLCRIISALGEGALCHICREHPRFYHVAGDRLECGIGASCEEAARLILSSPDYTSVEIGEGEPLDACEGAELDVLTAREELFSLLADRTRSYAVREGAITERCAVDATLTVREWRGLLRGLEYLKGRHRRLLAAVDPSAPDGGSMDDLQERFLAYLIYRHTAKAQNRREFDVLVGTSVLLTHAFAALVKRGLPPVEAAVLISEELEYSEDNFEQIRFAVEMHNI